MEQDFNIRKGSYVVPGMGRVNTNTPLPDKTKVALYLNRAFPFITLNPEGVKVLKRAKLPPKAIANLIQQAKSVEEVDLILEVRSNKILRTIAETRKTALAKP